MTRKIWPTFPDRAVGTKRGSYIVADAQIEVDALSDEQRVAIGLEGKWPEDLGDSVQSTWLNSRIVLADADFLVLMEHSLWTQVRNKIEDADKQGGGGSAEVFWTDVCIPRDTILYYSWGYHLSPTDPISEKMHQHLLDAIQGLVQIGGQANVGRGWVQGWVAQDSAPSVSKQPQTANVGES